jgi:two-component system response regulator DesR
MIVEALAELLRHQPDLELAGVAADLDEVIAVAQREKPDVILLDVRIPGTGERAAGELRALLPSAGIVAFSAYNDHATVRAMKSAGADEFLVKGARNDRVVAAIREAGRCWHGHRPVVRRGDVDAVS